MLDHNIVVLFIIFNGEFVEEAMSWFPHYHGREKLSTEPGTTSGANRLLDNSYLYGGVLAKLLGTREPGGAG